jgi:hypothetical protein
MTVNPLPPQGGAAAGAAIGGSTGTTAPGPAAGYPWDDLNKQLDVLRGQEQQANQVAAAAKGQWDAVANTPTSELGQAGTITSAAKQAALDAYVQSAQGLAKLKSDQAVVAANIATAKQQYNEQQDKNLLTPETRKRLDADTQAAQAQAALYGTQAAEAQAQIDLLKSPDAVASRAADTRLKEAQAQSELARQASAKAQDVLTAAQAADTAAHTGLVGAQAQAYPAESAAGITLQGAQANQAQATADATAETTQEHQRGALGTFINQITATAAAGLITPAEAERQIAAFAQAQATGATPYEWQQQADANARQVATSMIQSGQMVGPNQQYVAGGEPGGLLEQAAARWGFKAPAVHLNATGAPAYMQSLGMTTGTPQPQGQGAPAGGTPAYMQSLTGAPQGGLPDYSHLSLAQIEAMHGPSTPAAAPAPSGTATGPAGLPAGATAGGVNNGLLLGPIITGAPNYARLLAT